MSASASVANVWKIILPNHPKNSAAGEKIRPHTYSVEVDFIYDYTRSFMPP
jgi:hypothetical protein